jgi:hypothetical protein
MGPQPVTDTMEARAAKEKEHAAARGIQRTGREWAITIH